MSTLYVDTITEKTSGNGVAIADLLPNAGSVVQVKMGHTTSQVTVTSGSPTSVGLSVTITPSSASSKILVMSNVAIDTITSAKSAIGYLYRGSTQIQSNWFGYAYNAGGRDISTMSCHWLDEPNTTSATTYEFYLSGTNSIRTYSTGEKTITVMEIAQ